MPKISVIVPVYKVEPYLRRCIDSILAQTYTDFELILVDDGSPDNCGKICDEYAGRDDRIHVIHQENSGLSAARNAGIDRAFVSSDSQWLTFIDSDDWVHSEYLERLYNAAVEHNVAVSVCGYAETDGDEPDIAKADMKPQMWTPEDFYVEHNINAIIAWGKLYLKDLFQKIQYPVGKLHEDEYVTHEVLFQCKEIIVIDSPLYNYFINLEGITKSPWSVKRLDVLPAIKNQMEYMKQHNYRHAYIIAAQKYAIYIVDSIFKLQNSKYNDMSLSKKMLKELRKVIVDPKNKITIKNSFWLYELAFPFFTKIYKCLHIIKRRFNRKVKN